MIKLYSKNSIAEAVAEMKRADRFAHCFLLTGEPGVGKKFFADYIAMTLLCETGNACGSCRHCRRIMQGTHPDVIKPEKSGKKQIYSRDTIRSVLSDAFVSPNDCEAKVYIFSDCEGLEESTQNLMLKLIEEPPDPVYFIFTAADRSAFLPTVLSRMVTFGIPECTESECLAALEDMGHSAEQAEEAVRRFHGNIGSCLDWLTGSEAAENVKLCERILAAAAEGNEYALLTALHMIGEDRGRVKAVFTLLDKAVRDACMLRLGNIPLIGCDPEGSKRLSRTVSHRRAVRLHEAVSAVVSRCGTTMNVSAELAAFAGRVMSS